MAVLRRVNHRRFAADLGQTLPGARYVTNIDELASVVASESPTGQWLCKRPLSFAGRGRRKLARGALEPAAESWARASFRGGEGLQVEPWVDITSDVALHGFIDRAGNVTLGTATSQICDAQGAWRGSRAGTDLDAAEQHELRDSASLVGRALAQAGYFGPFGVDAFRWRENKQIRFNARSEINARYSMGWAIGMGEARPDLSD
jgi:hypothetical protein